MPKPTTPYRKKQVRPTRFPAIINWTAEIGGKRIPFDILIDEGGYNALKLNGHVIDGAALKTAADNARKDKKPLTAEDVRTVLTNEAAFKEPTQRDPDGEKIACGIDGEMFQPLKFLITNDYGVEEERGNYAILKVDDENFKKLVVNDPQIKADAEKLTKELLGNEKAPEKVLVLALCPTCLPAMHDRFIFSAFSREAVVDQVLERDTRIASTLRRRNALKNLESRRRPVEGTKGKFRDSQQLILVSFFGARLREDVVGVLDTLIEEGKIPSDPVKALTFVNGMTNEDMVSMRTKGGASILSDAGDIRAGDNIRYYTGQAIQGKKDLANFQANTRKVGMNIGSQKANAEALKRAKVVASTKSDTTKKRTGAPVKAAKAKAPVAKAVARKQPAKKVTVRVRTASAR